MKIESKDLGALLRTLMDVGATVRYRLNEGIAAGEVSIKFEANGETYGQQMCFSRFADDEEVGLQFFYMLHKLRNGLKSLQGSVAPTLRT